MSDNRRCRFLILFLLILVVCFFISYPAYAGDQSSVYSDAVSFYSRYGSRNLIFHDGAFYYASRGRSGKETGTRYGVEGQEFILTADDNTYRCSVALNSSENPGSCVRISYVKQGSYYYSLYQVKYENLFEMMSLRYPDTDFNSIMYNHRIHFQIDFYLCIEKKGSSSGIVLEQKDGRQVFKGKIYTTAEEILSAENWSAETRKIIPGYYNITLDIFQPSQYFIEFHSSDESTKGTMEKQTMVYGVAEDLNANSFQLTHKITYHYGKPDGIDIPDSESRQDEKFEGWADSENGKILYSDSQKVKNLTAVENDTVHLHAVWTLSEFEIADFTDMILKNYEFLGWSLDRVCFLESGCTEEEINNVIDYRPGQIVTADRDINLYAVYKKIKKGVRFISSVQKSVISSLSYSKEDISELKQIIRKNGYLGQKLNLLLIKTGKTYKREMTQDRSG